ncbi:MAG: cation diffusion facilitator family transporter [Gemmataceae bacterium]
MNNALRIPILLSISAAILTIGLKFLAYWITDSVGLLSDALESLINLAAALTAYLSLWYAAKPVDESHTYGHEKIEFFSSGLEGGLILMAAAGIAYTALHRLVHPHPPEALGLGLSISLVAALINGVVATILLRAARQHHSIVLEADGHHLLTDVWTSVAVVFGLSLVALTGWPWLDPIIALLVAFLILWTALSLVRRSFHGLMDHALPPHELDLVRATIRQQLRPSTDFHALRSRQAGARRFLDFHLLVPGTQSVKEAHDHAEEVEAALHGLFPNLEITIHLEPIEASRSWEDSELLGLEQKRRLRRGEEPMPGVQVPGER